MNQTSWVGQGQLEQATAQARSVMAALLVVADDHGVVGDPQARHRVREILGRDQHPARMPGGRRRDAEVRAPVAMHSPGEVASDVLDAHVTVERETTVDHPDARITQRRGDLLGRPEQVWPRERAHPRMMPDAPG